MPGLRLLSGRGVDWFDRLTFTPAEGIDADNALLNLPAASGRYRIDLALWIVEDDRIFVGQAG
jgi:hypothetical protein